MGGARTALFALATALLVAVAANAAEWQAQGLEPGSGAADVAIDADGNAVAVWTTEQSGSPVRTSIRVAGGQFEPPRTIDACGAMLPRVDVDAQGNFTALWVGCDGTVQVATGTAPSGFGPATTIAPPGNDARAYPVLDVAPSGAAVAAWQVAGRAEGAIRASGGSWGPSETISPGPLTAWNQWEAVQAGIDSNGAAVVLLRRWLHDPSPQQALGSEPDYKIDQVAAGRVGAGFGQARTIDESGELQEVHLGVGSGGETLISWIVHGTSTAVGVIAGTTADPLAGDPSEAFRSADQSNERPVPHIDGSGRAYIVFGRNGTALLEAPSVTGPWGTPQSISSVDPTIFESAVSEAGEVVVATQNDRTTNVHLRLAGTGDFLHSNAYDGYPGWMAAAVNAGRAAVLWVQSDRHAVVYDGPAPPPADSRPPRCDVDNFRHPERGGFSFVTECDEAASVTATVVMRAPKRTNLGALTARLRADRARTLRLRTRSKGRRALARAAARRDPVVVKLVLTATDTAGNSRVVRRRMAILAGE